MVKSARFHGKDLGIYLYAMKSAPNFMKFGGFPNELRTHGPIFIVSTNVS